MRDWKFIEWFGLEGSSQDQQVQSPRHGQDIPQHWISSMDGPKSGTLAPSLERLIVPVLPWEDSSAAK